MPEQWISAHIPDARYPSDNEWDIPLLRPDLQPVGIDLPLVIWGSRGRRGPMQGTWAFYTDDYRWTGLWTRPQALLNTRCAAVVEPNFSIHDQTPRARALDAIYRKRWLCRTWQELAGVRIWVDLHVHPLFCDLNLMGVPKGWRAYATRGHANLLPWLERDYATATTHAGTENILFAVYGGGKAVKELCRSYGWIWVAEQQDQATLRPIAAEPTLHADQFMHDE